MQSPQTNVARERERDFHNFHNSIHEMSFYLHNKKCNFHVVFASDKK